MIIAIISIFLLITFIDFSSVKKVNNSKKAAVIYFTLLFIGFSFHLLISIEATQDLPYILLDKILDYFEVSQ